MRLRIITVTLAVAIIAGCVSVSRQVRAPVKSDASDGFAIIEKGELFIGTTKNFLPSRLMYVLKGTNSWLVFRYCDDFEGEKRIGSWEGKTLTYDYRSRTVDWVHYDLNLRRITSGQTRVSYGGWTPNSGIPFPAIQKIINNQPIVRIGEFMFWNEVYRDYAWVTFKDCRANSSPVQLAILPEGVPIAKSRLSHLQYYEITH